MRSVSPDGVSDHRTDAPWAPADTVLSDALSRVHAMVVFSNHRLGPTAELMVSREVAAALLREVAGAAGPAAQARWEHELVSWLERWAAADSSVLDVSDIAWTPDNFERQRGFLIEAIRRAAGSSPHARALLRWCGMVEAHPRESVQVGRRWRWPISQITT
jgi:hypothetical protein